MGLIRFGGDGYGKVEENYSSRGEIARVCSALLVIRQQAEKWSARLDVSLRQNLHWVIHIYAHELFPHLACLSCVASAMTNDDNTAFN